jgi:hypothetical protein
MYEVQTQDSPGRDMQTEESTAAALDRQLLERQLQRDVSGALRDRLFGELRGAAQDIEAALARRPDAEQAKILQSLLDAVLLSEDLIFQVWDSYHASITRPPAAGTARVDGQ